MPWYLRCMNDSIVLFRDRSKNKFYHTRAWNWFLVQNFAHDQKICKNHMNNSCFLLDKLDAIAISSGTTFAKLVLRIHWCTIRPKKFIIAKNRFCWLSTCWGILIWRTLNSAMHIVIWLLLFARCHLQVLNVSCKFNYPPRPVFGLGQ